MVICPECGYPYEDDQLLVSEKKVQCDNCPWRGSSADLLMTEGAAPAYEMQQLYQYIGRELAPMLGRRMVQLGLLQRSSDTENIAMVARVLREGTRGAFRGVLDELYREEEHEQRN